MMKEKKQKKPKKTLRYLLTEEGEALNGMPWNVYPRPQLERENWQCLNGNWEFGTGEGDLSREIRVPFCPESLLSGIREDMADNTVLYYRKRFSAAPLKNGHRMLLHFGAVDQVAAVYLNSRCLGIHMGGYLPFEFDISDKLQAENELYVTVSDPILSSLPYGKQKRKHGGMWYTPISGIWQTVWLEEVPRVYVKKLEIECSQSTVSVSAQGVRSGELVLEDGSRYPLKEGRVRFEVADPHLWSPEDPYLYRFRLECGEDRVRSYFALRSLSTEIADGTARLCLNGKPYFFHGLLDQGYWSDGLYTPASPEAFEKDILAAKALGFNTLRMHLKVEAERFYYDCDRLGMAVFQDMVNGGSYRFVRDSLLPNLGFTRRSDRSMNRDERYRASFMKYASETVIQLKNHPCICLWTIFNEGWGQFCGDDAYEALRKLDGSRFIDTASGWFRQQKSDVDSRHVYFRKLRLKPGEKPLILSEFGGYACRIPEHSASEKIYGYKKCASPEAFSEAMRKLYDEQLLPAVRNGLSASVLTQLSDVEEETNGLLTWDRKVKKQNFPFVITR